jgi:hypothetical protein
VLLRTDARVREVKARPILERLHAWLLQRRTQVPNGSGNRCSVATDGSDCPLGGLMSLRFCSGVTVDSVSYG